ncbi:YitT family protein [Alkalihalobacterium alkalinitrilicum]|uniref:YitT family protein n=1 Tax=Alkalihalobacterium alkalinitrilicum TaxID=427920 RepID=UPI00099528A0|nr:YitT family protein [Alkalihalobacterium alkalinitrilicum]
MLKSLTAILIGSLLISYGINQFFIPHHILDGGMIGVGLIIHYVWELDVGFSIILLSIPIYILAWIYYRAFFFYSIPGFIISSLFIDWFSFLVLPYQVDPLLSAILGGLILGAGVGIMFREDISTGGFDLLAQMIAEKTKVNIGIMIFIIDFLVVIGGIFVITPTEVLLSVIAVTATGFSTMLLTLDTHGTIHTSF